VSTGAPLLEVTDLRHAFPGPARLLGRRAPGIVAVDGVSLTVEAGTTLGLVGESGSGKSTLARAILRLLPGTTGSVRYRPAGGGQPLELLAVAPRALRPLRRELQIVFQDPFASLNPRLSVGEIVGEGVRHHGLARGAELERAVLRALERVGLPAAARARFPHEFSGGQRQRIALARALALEPRLVVCDEPTSSLDVSIQAQILNLLLDLQAELGLAYLLISHDISVVRYLARDVAVMRAGRIVESGPAAAVLERPSHAYTRALLAAVPGAGRAANGVG
jgi:ABC-type microcin C transport system duplicated ATPase subunit YejF